MRFGEEIVLADVFEGDVQRAVVEENRAQQGALNFEVMRDSPVDCGCGRHRVAAIILFRGRTSSQFLRRAVNKV